MDKGSPRDVDGISWRVPRKIRELGSPTRCWVDVTKTVIGMRFKCEHAVLHSDEIKGKIKDLWILVKL